MALINQDIKNLVSGISQQPAVLRHPEQLEEQINGLSTEASGLQKRPPTLFEANLGQSINTTNKPLIHFIDRDTEEKYMVIFTGAGIEVYDLQGNKQTVNIKEDVNYIYTQSPRSNIKTVTIADYTFITNTLQATKMSDTVDTNKWNTQGLLVNIKSGQYGRTYKIVVNGTTIASYETPDGSDKSHSKQIATDYIAQQLATQCVSNGYPTTTGSSWLYIEKTAYKTETGETVYNQPSTSLQQQLDIFKGLMANYHYQAILLGAAYLVSTVVQDSANTLTVTIPRKDSLTSESDIAAYEKTYAEIQRCAADKWKLTTSTGTLTYTGIFSSSVEAEAYTLTWASSTDTPTYSISKSVIESAEVYDGYNNQAAFGILKSVQKFSNLPATAPDGYIVKVIGEDGSNTDDYYVKYDSTEKVWQECVRPGLKNSYDTSTLPHVLVREADGTFT